MTAAEGGPQSGMRSVTISSNCLFMQLLFLLCKSSECQLSQKSGKPGAGASNVLIVSNYLCTRCLASAQVLLWIIQECKVYMCFATLAEMYLSAPHGCLMPSCLQDTIRSCQLYHRKKKKKRKERKLYHRLLYLSQIKVESDQI